MIEFYYPKVDSCRIDKRVLHEREKRERDKTNRDIDKRVKDKRSTDKRDETTKREQSERDKSKREKSERDRDKRNDSVLNDSILTLSNGAPKIMTKFKDKPYSYELLPEYLHGEKKFPCVKAMNWEGKTATCSVIRGFVKATCSREMLTATIVYLEIGHSSKVCPRTREE